MSIIAESRNGDKLKKKLIKKYRSHQKGIKYKLRKRDRKFRPTIEEVKAAAGLTEDPKFICYAARIVRLPDMKPIYISVPVYLINNRLVRILPSFLLPLKQYPIFVIEDVLNEEVPVNINPEDVPDYSEPEIIINENSTTPLPETRKNWNEWYGLNQNVFATVISPLIDTSDWPGDACRIPTDCSSETLVNYFRAAKGKDWLEYLLTRANKRKLRLKCAPWNEPKVSIMHAAA